MGTTLDYIHVPGLKALDESDQCSADSDSPGRGLQIKFYPFVLPGGIYVSVVRLHIHSIGLPDTI